MANTAAPVLAACPFCGSEVAYVHNVSLHCHAMVHVDAMQTCDLHVLCYTEEMRSEEFIARWNTRSDRLAQHLTPAGSVASAATENLDGIELVKVLRTRYAQVAYVHAGTWGQNPFDTKCDIERLLDLAEKLLEEQRRVAFNAECLMAYAGGR